MEYIDGDELVCNTDFIDWIVRYTNDETIFSDDYLVLFPDIIAEEDKGYIKKLSFFYIGILNYLERNYVYPEETEFSKFVKIKYKGLGFEIGVIFGQGSITYCNRITIDDENEFIDFMDIVNKERQKNALEIDKQLIAIKDMILKAIENGVPAEAIKNVLNADINTIDTDKGQSRTLVNNNG